MIRRPPRSTHCISSAASDVYKRQILKGLNRNQSEIRSLSMKQLPPFHDRLKAYSAAAMDKMEIESSNKSNLCTHNISNIAAFIHHKAHKKENSIPMFFRLSVGEKKCETYCGTREFTAAERTCILPYWMMSNLLLTEGEHVDIAVTKLPKGTALSIQPFDRRLSEASVTREE
eukprot:TRINITY_DN11000_c0_g1_i2.p1 TRINITY_DN11000_c0_g1~~TRINITY_DN11000_c0_g1_i2.p1  ORF type:complete len:180 (-),score=34.11 TRINITY_DN11000_c0_g1_i2:1576-2094(-)